MQFPDFFFKRENVQISYCEDINFIQIKVDDRILIQRKIKNTDVIMSLISPGSFELSENIRMIYDLENMPRFKNERACYIILSLGKQILNNILTQGAPTVVYSVIQSFFITLCSKIRKVNYEDIHMFIEKSFDILELKIKNINCLSDRSILKNYYNRCTRYKEIFKNSLIKFGIFQNNEEASEELSEISDIQFKILQLLFIVKFEHKFTYLPYIMIYNREIHIKIPNEKLIMIGF